MNDPKPVLNKIYVETNQSANSLRNLIVKMLKEFNLKISDYKIYFRADYTELNK
jgi:ribose 5-phosphate isomerase RpiB